MSHLSNLDLLRLVSVLSKKQSLSRAAVEMGLSLSTASRLLQEARTHFKDPVVVRSGMKMTLTGRMERMLSEIDPILAAVDRLGEERVFRPSDIHQTFRIASLDMALMLLVLPAIERCRAAAPGAAFDVVPLSKTSMGELESGELDFVIFGTPDVVISHNVHSLTLLHSPYVIILRKDHPLVSIWREKGDVSADDLARFELLALMAPISATQPHVGGAWIDWSEQASVVSIPYQTAGLRHLLRSDRFMVVPKPFAEAMATDGNGFAVIPFRHSNREWEPTIFWHARVHRDPVSEWLRGMMSLAAEELVLRSDQTGSGKLEGTPGTVRI